MKKTVLVTGGAGYIGSHTAVELVGAGYDVVIADNLSNSDLGSVEGVRRITGVEVPFEQMDCNDHVAFGELFRRYRFDGVIHFAAFKAVTESASEPLEYYRNNIGSLVTLLELMREHEVPNVVLSSSAAVYGDAETLPVTEKAPRQPATSPYGNTKQICEDILRDSAMAYEGMRGIALRYFNVIGAHPSSLIGERTTGVPSNIMPFITQTAAGIRETLSIFGGDYDTPDGTALRDFIDVVDLARAHVAAVGRMLAGKQRTPYEVYNVGTGRPVSILELVRGFERANGLKLNYRIVGRRPGDIIVSWADTTQAEKELGWRSHRSLEETLRSAWEWEQSLRE